jgi:hypothetical protein
MYMKKYVIYFAFVLAAYNGYSQCTNSSGTQFQSKSCTSYNCHQYVRAALIGGYVNMTTGVPSNECAFSSYSSGNISSGDNNFIRVCNNSEAQAIVPVGNGADHSGIILSGGFPNGSGFGDFAATPNGSSALFRHGDPESFTTACTHQVYAVIANVIVSGPSGLNPGTSGTYTINLPSYITADANRWSVDPNFFTINSQNNTSITVTAKTGTGGTGYIRATLTTACVGAGFKPVKEKLVSVLADCGGTINGSQLNTFNTVSSGAANTVSMNASSFTWVKNSGNTNYWYTGSGGKFMYFSISSGCATFNAYGSGCNLTRTFCASGARQSTHLNNVSNFKVLDLHTGKVQSDGVLADPGDMSSITEKLPPGFYVIYVDGVRKKIVIRD